MARAETLRDFLPFVLQESVHFDSAKAENGNLPRNALGDAEPSV